jgi:hypothetical protein
MWVWIPDVRTPGRGQSRRAGWASARETAQGWGSAVPLGCASAPGAMPLCDAMRCAALRCDGLKQVLRCDAMRCCAQEVAAVPPRGLSSSGMMRSPYR